MNSKILVLLGLMAALVLFFSSEAAARDLAETTTAIDVKETSATETTDVNDATYGDGYRGYPGGGYGGYPGGGYGGRGGYGGGYPGSRHDRGRGCYYGSCCGYGRCRCCAYAGEVIEAKPQN